MIRAAEPSDALAVRRIRLSALADAPDAFGSTHERELAFSDDTWRERLANARAITFVADERGDLTGLAVGALDDEHTAMANLFSMWVRPDRRGRGVADGLVDHVVGWARGQEAVRQVRLQVTEGNERAERLYERHGFTRTGSAVARERDGRVEIEMALSLDPA